MPVSGAAFPAYAGVKLMLRKMVSLLLACFLFNSLCGATVIARRQATKEEEISRKVKAKVTKLGTKARVEVKLKDGSKLKGHISEINEDHFVVRDDKAGSVTTISYAQAKEVKAPYENFSDPKAWLGIALLPVIIIFAILSKGS